MNGHSMRVICGDQSVGLRWRRKTMSYFFFRRAHCLLLSITLSTLAAAQLSIPQLGTSTPAPGNRPVDQFGRETPEGTFLGFLQAAQAGNYTKAAQYLQMPSARRTLQGEDLAAKLKAVLDRAFTGNLGGISNNRDGVPQEGVPLDHQRLGTLSAGDIETDLELVHVADSGGNRIWLISSETLAKVPELYEQLQVRQVETHLPSFLVHHQILGIPIWQWLAILTAIPLAAIFALIAVQIVKFPRYVWLRKRKQSLSRIWAAITGPLWLLLATAIHNLLVKYLRLPLLQRHYYQILVGVVLIIGFNWLLWRILQHLAQRVRERALYAGRSGTGSFMLLGERILKALILILAVFLILGTLGFNMTTALAGLGIGGIAIAFAAQKTLENLFGGVSLLGDDVIHIGDVCRFGDRVGTIEDISLRSTRIRTPERTELSIPNGTLATMNVDNLSRRDKFLFNTKLNLRPESSPDQLRYVLAQVRRLLYEHPKVETSSARIRLVGYDAGQPILEVFCYILTRDNNDFLAIQEDLLLSMTDIVAASGSSFASPSRTIYMGQDRGLDQEKTAAAAREVQQWRDSNTLPFPDHAPADVSEFSNSAPYPPPGSALRSSK